MMTAHTTRLDSVALQVFCKTAFPLAFPVHSYPQPKQTVNLLFPRFEGFDSVRHRSQPMKKSAFSPTPCSDFVTPQFFTQDQPAATVELSRSLDAKSASPLDWILDPNKPTHLNRELELQLDSPANRVARILSRMAWQEATEKRNPHVKADRRIAWITVKWSLEGVPSSSHYAALPAFTAATFTVLRCAPDEVWPRILANRKEKLGAEYSDWYDAAGNLRPDAPKKDSASAGQRKAEVA